MKAALVVCLASLWVAATWAQSSTPVWRCGPDGRIYSDTPCPGGTHFNAGDSRSPEQVQQAAQLAAREKALGAAYAEQRRALERERRAQAQAQATRQAVKPTKAEPPKKPKKARAQDAGEQTFRAVAPSSRQKKD